MLTFERGKITGNSLGGSITAQWVHCPECLRCLTTDDIKVDIDGVSYCVRCAAKHYSEGRVLNATIQSKNKIQHSTIY